MLNESSILFIHGFLETFETDDSVKLDYHMYQIINK